MWDCKSCGTQGIAGDLVTCPACGTAQGTVAEPAPAAPGQPASDAAAKADPGTGIATGGPVSAAPTVLDEPGPAPFVSPKQAVEPPTTIAPAVTSDTPAPDGTV